LYDQNLAVLEWNASAERLYGWSRTEVTGQRLPTIPSEREPELLECLAQVAQHDAAVDRETVRQNRQRERIEVQLSLLPFRERSDGYFLEVTADIRERVRLRQRLIELEKLTSMGQMAAGTAHHLNTPLASMLLRIQMMRERADVQNGFSQDLQRLDQTIVSASSLCAVCLIFRDAQPSRMSRRPLAP
jgi:PAS domain S-box-containing protein